MPQRQNSVDNNMSGDISIALGLGASTIGIIGYQREKDYFAHGKSSTKARHEATSYQNRESRSGPSPTRTVTTNYRKGNIF